MYHICEYGWPKMLCVSLMKDIIVIIYLFLSDIWKFAGRLSLSLLRQFMEKSKRHSLSFT